jgi:hypothetical protein
MDFQNELKKRRMHAIRAENTAALHGKAHEVADFIEVEILKSMGRRHFLVENTARFSYIPETVKGLEHKSVLYSPNFKIMSVEDVESKSQYVNISYPKIEFPTDGIFLNNVLSLLKMQKITAKEINRDRGYIIFEWSLDTHEWVTDSAKPENSAEDLIPEEG